MRYLVIVLLGAVGAVAACTPFDPSYSNPEPFRCANQSPRCPSGFICDESASFPAPTCVRKAGTGPDGGTSGPDGAATNSCSPIPDADLEPNDSTGSAIQLPANTPRYEVDMVGICTANYVDMYWLQLNGGDHLVARIDFTHIQGDLTLALLDQAATQLRFSDSSSVSQNFESVDITNATAGKYYIKVAGKDPSVRNVYSLVTEINP